ncbi:MAG: rhomboid family intramembrane serine protease [Methanomassiliicoccaceae archaeon]|jgi:membrane associated rhomboid family serine protease|nr:rhomboid family intramembrane serine protease [Methanomassiliicoccaceae archaeon]
METASWIVIVLIIITIAILLRFRKLSPTLVLVISNTAIFAVTDMGYPDGHFNWTLFELGFIPPEFFAGNEPWTLLTSMFLHMDILHLIFNMLFLMLIGLALESRIGRWRFISVYLLGGVIGGLTFGLLEQSSSVYLIGASGAISALFGAMLMLYPRDRIWMPVGPVITNRFPVRTTALVWFSVQLLLFLFDNSGVAYAAHLSGFMAGAVIAWVLGLNYFAMLDDRRNMYDISSLKLLCTTPTLRERYDYAERARDSETRKMWTDSILDEVACPECGAHMRMRKGHLECERGHRT